MYRDRYIDLTVVCECTSGTLKSQRGSPYLTQTVCDINEVHVDDPKSSIS